MKRSGKFWRKNEQEVMKLLGFEPTKNSGSGWIEKEDGQSEDMICQLKSTDASSIRINKKDIDVLLHNAAVSHKIPVFAIQFLQSNEVYILVKPDQIEDVAMYIKTGERSDNPEMFVGIDLSETENMTSYNGVTKVSSSSRARDQFKKKLEKKFSKKERSAT